jgi:uncharacterized protein HemX
MKKIAMILTVVLGLSVSAFADNGQMNNAQISGLKQKTQEMRQKTQEMRQQNNVNNEQMKANYEKMKANHEQMKTMRQQNRQNNSPSTQK